MVKHPVQFSGLLTNISTFAEEISTLGVKSPLLIWFKSYLINRTHFVSYNSINSDSDVTHCISQGSTLGPLLFIIYMNDFSNSSKLLFSIIFGDNTTLLTEGKERTL